MVSFRSLTAVLAAASAATALNTVSVKNQEFIDDKTGQRFMVLGVDYQPGGQAGYKPQDGADVLTDKNACLRDAAIIQSLGANTVRIYNIDPDLNHDDCMSIFNYAGIYVILDVNSPLVGESIDRSAPWTTYTEAYLTRVFKVIEAFKSYPNTLAFFAGNEIINDDSTTTYNPQYIRAVQRDMKNYIAKHSSRKIPVGYSAADVRDVLRDTWAYLQCAIDGDNNDMSRSDFFGLNSYSWCGDATFHSSTYDQLVEFFSDSTIPTFFSEYGCTKVKPRTFSEVATLYGTQMTVLSGGLVYEYSMEAEDFGLVQINSNGTVSLLSDFDSLQAAYNKVNVTLVESANSTATSLTPPPCSSNLINATYFDKNFTLPATPAQSLIDNGVPSAPAGKLVDVSSTSVPVAVYGTNGNAVSGLTLQSRSSQNTPGGANTSSGNPTGTSSGSSPSATKKSAASSLSPLVGLSTIISAMAFALLML